MLPTPRLRIPERDHEALADLLTLSEAEGSKLLMALEAAKPTVIFEELTASVLSHFPSPEDAPRVARLVNLLVTLFAVRKQLGLSIADFVQALRRAATTTKNPAFESDEAWGRTGALLSKALTLDRTVGVASKAADVLEQYPAVFKTARILTDLRPVFTPGDDAKPVAGIVVHQLKIEFLEGENEREFFVAVADEELNEIISALQRAAAKARNLREIVRVGGLPTPQ